MAKAIITIDDSNNGFDIVVTFDPPMPETEEGRANTMAPPSALLAGEIMTFIKVMLSQEPEQEEQA